jgi:hypothetical protein
VLADLDRIATPFPDHLPEPAQHRKGGMRRPWFRQCSRWERLRRWSRPSKPARALIPGASWRFFPAASVAASLYLLAYDLLPLTLAAVVLLLKAPLDQAG